MSLNEFPSTNSGYNKRTAHPYAWSFYMTFSPYWCSILVRITIRATRRVDFLTDRYFFFLLLSSPCDFRFVSDMIPGIENIVIDVGRDYQLTRDLGVGDNINCLLQLILRVYSTESTHHNHDGLDRFHAGSYAQTSAHTDGRKRYCTR